MGDQQAHVGILGATVSAPFSGTTGTRPSAAAITVECYFSFSYDSMIMSLVRQSAI